MSFTQETFATVGAQSADTPTIYSYKTDDSDAEVSTSGYFAEKENEFDEGDILLAQVSDGFVILEVLADTSSVKITGQAISNRVIINNGEDFPDAVGGRIPLADNTEYYIGSNAVSVPDGFLVGENVTINGAGAPALLTYTGTGNMFEGDGVGLFAITRIAVDLPNGGTVFDINDTVQSSVINVLDYRVLSCASLGTVTNVVAFVMEFGSIFDMDDGITIVGSAAVVSIDKMFGFSTSATFKAVNLGTSVAPTIELTNMALTAPAGAVGIAGAADNANLPAGSVATVTSCEFLGGMAALSGITEDDIRWAFNGNSGIIGTSVIKDTFPDALISLTGNALETVIGDVGVPTKVNGVWVVEGGSHFTGDTTGRITYNGERQLSGPIDVSVTIQAAGGTNKSIRACLALNGVAIDASSIPNKVGQNDPRSLSVIWQLTLSKDDYLEVFISNDSDLVNLIGISGVLRVK